MAVRFITVLACAMLVAGCTSNALDPDAKPPKLDDAGFATWVDQVNRTARHAVATGVGETALARIQDVFDAVASTVEEKPGEASWIVSEWRNRSGNIGTLFDYFRSRDYLLNYYFFERGSDLLVPLERDRYGLTLARESLDALFGSGDYVSPWIVDSPDFVFGTSYGLTPVVNRAKALNLYEWIREHFEKTTRFSGRLDFGSVMQVIAANEVAHATLMQRYGFSVESEFDPTPRVRGDGQYAEPAHDCRRWPIRPRYRQRLLAGRCIFYPVRAADSEPARAQPGSGSNVLKAGQI